MKGNAIATLTILNPMGILAGHSHPILRVLRFSLNKTVIKLCSLLQLKPQVKLLQAWEAFNNMTQFVWMNSNQTWNFLFGRWTLLFCLCWKLLAFSSGFVHFWRTFPKWTPWIFSLENFNSELTGSHQVRQALHGKIKTIYSQISRILVTSFCIAVIFSSRSEEQSKGEIKNTDVFPTL